MRLVGDKVILRYPRLEDAKPIYFQINKAEVSNNIVFGFGKKTLNDEIKWINNVLKKIKKKEEVHFVIIDKSSGNIAGAGEFYKLDLKFGYGESGLWVGEAFFGTGIAVEAARLILNYGFKNLGLYKVGAEIMDYNKRSIKFTTNKLGFTPEGIIKA